MKRIVKVYFLMSFFLTSESTKLCGVQKAQNINDQYIHTQSQMECTTIVITFKQKRDKKAFKHSISLNI